MTMLCDRCLHQAVIYQRYSGVHLCREHFVRDVERRIKKDTRKMVEGGDRIAVALSGGKDSTLLLYVLSEIFEKRRDIEILAITIDEGIRGYREHTIRVAKNMTKNLGIEHIITPFRDRYDTTLDELVRTSDVGPCTLCGVLRRGALNWTAKEASADKIATGHNLDDEAQTVLMNYLRGDVKRLFRQKRRDDFIPRIKPLKGIPEKEVALYGFIKGLDVDLHECPYATQALRSEMRELINDYEVKHPGTKYALVRGFEEISNIITYPEVQLSRCKICGEPTSNDVCMACLLSANGSRENNTHKSKLRPTSQC